jgi:hypothetical protein
MGGVPRVPGPASRPVVEGVVSRKDAAGGARRITGQGPCGGVQPSAEAVCRVGSGGEEEGS